MRVVIIGSKGMLGTALVERFSHKHEVVGLDRPEIDITDEASTQTKLETLAPEVLINCAAINAVDDIESKNDVFELAWKVNAKAVETLALVAKTLNIPLVHFSSDYVFDGTNDEGYVEDFSPKPISKYGETKFEGERLLESVTSKYYLIRLSRLFGRPGIGEGMKKSFVDKMLEIAEAGKELKVVDAEVGSPTYSVDLADFVYKLLEKQLPYGVYHGANSGACTWYEWAGEIFRLKNMPVSVERIDPAGLIRPAKRPAYSELINTKTEPPRSWQEALNDYISSL